jgi:hypothetical protein
MTAMALNFGGFSEEALNAYSELVQKSELQKSFGINAYSFSEGGETDALLMEAYQLLSEDFSEGSYDFTTCMRPDGSKYGTGGQCRKGTQTDAAIAKVKTQMQGHAKALARARQAGSESDVAYRKEELKKSMEKLKQLRTKQRGKESFKDRENRMEKLHGGKDKNEDIYGSDKRKKEEARIQQLASKGDAKAKEFLAARAKAKSPEVDPVSTGREVSRLRAEALAPGRQAGQI